MAKASSSGTSSGSGKGSSGKSSSGKGYGGSSYAGKGAALTLAGKEYGGKGYSNSRQGYSGPKSFSSADVYKSMVSGLSDMYGENTAKDLALGAGVNLSYTQHKNGSYTLSMTIPYSGQGAQEDQILQWLAALGQAGMQMQQGYKGKPALYGRN